MFKTLSDRDPAPPHPGEILREDILPHVAMSRAELARHLGVSARTLGDVLAEKRAVSLDLAVRLGAALGQGARYWLGLQTQHDIWQASHLDTAPVRPIVWGKRV